MNVSAKEMIVSILEVTDVACVTIEFSWKLSTFVNFEMKTTQVSEKVKYCALTFCLVMFFFKLRKLPSIGLLTYWSSFIQIAEAEIKELTTSAAFVWARFTWSLIHRSEGKDKQKCTINVQL